MPLLSTAIFRDTAFELHRLALRKDGMRLIFDCHNALICKEGDRVKCAAGHRLGIASDGGITLMSVLKGRPCSVFCPNYDDGGTFGD